MCRYKKLREIHAIIPPNITVKFLKIKGENLESKKDTLYA